MKTLLSLTLVLFALSTVNSQTALAQAKVKEISVNINDALVPTTVSADKEDVKAIITGLFPNGCYSFKDAEVTKNNVEKIHKVRTVAEVSLGMCIMVLVPFTKEVQLGTFPEGTHTIRFVNGDETYMDKVIVAR